jgi:potassium/hydrogen antiporter
MEAILEPTRLAVAMLVMGALVGIAALLTRLTGRRGFPFAILFLGVGMLAGSEGLGGIEFSDHALAYRIGIVALVLILFDGGLNTPFARVRSHLAPSVVLATAGVILTAGAVAAAARLVGFSWTEALLVGAIVSSTDAAAVFAALRGSSIHLEHRVGATIELESGLNDPMAVILTVTMTELALTGKIDGPALAWQVPLQLVIGGGVGVLIGWATRAVLTRVLPSTMGLVPVVTSSASMIAYGGATLLWGSGFLAVYVAGVVLGNRDLPDRAGIRRVHDFLAWFSQVAMFLALGLLVFPSQLITVAPLALIVAAVLVFAGRPLAVALCLLPFRYPPKEVVFIGWTGLRGAVPIILAAFPVLAGFEGGMLLFNSVFFIVVVSALLQGGTVRWLTRKLGLQSTAPPAPAAALEIASMGLLEDRVACYHIDPGTAVAGSTVAEVPFPPEASIMLVVRGSRLLAARGSTRLEVGDHVWIFCRPEDEPLLGLWFGRRLDQ